MTPHCSLALVHYLVYLRESTFESGQVWKRLKAEPPHGFSLPKIYASSESLLLRLQSACRDKLLIRKSWYFRGLVDPSRRSDPY